MFVCVALCLYCSCLCVYVFILEHALPTCVQNLENATAAADNSVASTANLRSKILDFGRFYSSRILIVRGGILVSAGNFPEYLIQQILVGIILVGSLGVPTLNYQSTYDI